MSYSFGKRVISSILAIVMVLGYIPAPAMAAQEDGLCEHHPKHTAECGYAPAAEGKPCGHEHTEECYRSVTECVHTHGDCGYVPAVAEQLCACEPDENGELIHQEGCGYQAAVAEVPCDHVCSEDSGCMNSVLDCRHVHDGNCGYAEAKAETPCTYDCAECAAEETPVVGDIVSEGTGAAGTEGAGTEGADTGAAGTEGADTEAADPVAAQIAALPTVEEIRAMSTEERSDAYEQVQAAYRAYNALTDTQKALIPNAESTFASLFACFDALDEPAYTVLSSGTCGENLTWELTEDGTLTITGSGPMTGFSVGETFECVGPWKEYASEIRTLVVEDGVTSIFDQSFVYCTNLEQISIPDSVTEIGAFAFYGCDSLTAVTIPAGVDTIVTGAFAGCTKLTSITVAEDNSDYCDVDGVLFDKAKTTLWTYPAGRKATSYTIPEGVTTIQEASFSVASNLTEIILPNGVSEIGNGAFSFCDQLEKITLPDSISRIGYGAFQLCGSLKEVCYTGTEAQWNAILIEDENDNLKNANILYGDPTIGGTCGENLTWTLADDGTLTISGTGAMADYEYTTGATPNSEYGGANTPWHSYRINSIVIENGVTAIGAFAFYYLTYVESVSLPESLRSIGTSAFASDQGLSQLDLPDGLEELGDFALFQCHYLDRLEIPASLRTIGQGAFSNCGLSEITVADGNTAFCAENGILYTVDKTRLIAFTSNRNTLTIADSVTQMDASALLDGDSLQTLTIGANLRDQFSGSYYFPSLKQILVSEENDALCVKENVLYTKDGTELILYPSAREASSYVIPAGTQKIRAFAFSECPKLTAIAIPDGLTTLEYQAICCVNLQGLNIPASVVTMEYECVGYSYGTKLENFTIFGYPGTVAETYAAENEITFVAASGQECTVTFDAQGGTGAPEDMTVTAGQMLTLPETIPTREGYAFFGWALTQGSKVADYQPGEQTIRYADTTLYAVWLPQSTVSTGQCGDDLVWILSQDGTLTISGTGRMYDYYYYPDDNGDYQPSTPMPGLNATRLVIEEGVTYIGYSAFRDCTTLTGELVIPGTMTQISGSAFEGCTGFTGDLVIPESMVTIDSYTFSHCGFDGELVLPESLRTIEQYAFFSCSGLTGSLTLPDGLSSIGEHAFYDCSGFTGSLTLPDGLSSIGEYAFYGCSGFTGDLALPDSVTNVGMYAFNSCTGLTGSLTLPGSLGNVPDGAFYSCRNLNSVTVQDGIQSIGSWAFANCDGLRTLTLPASVVAVADSAFSGISPSEPLVCFYGGTQEQWESVTIGQNNSCLTEADMRFQSDTLSGTCGDNLTWTLANDGTLTISGTGNMANYPWINSDGTEGTHAPWYQYRDEILCVVISEGVTTIGECAFDGCSNLTSVTIPEGVTEIGNATFEECSSLTSVTIPGSVTFIGERAFYGCSSLTSVTIPEGVPEIGNAAFRGCTSLTSVTIPESITSIGTAAFRGCSSLTSVTIPEGVTSIGDSAFSGCTSLTSITIPGSITSISAFTFGGCSSLTSVTIPESVTSIGARAFTQCSSLTSITIPEGVTEIGYATFEECSSLTSVTIPEGVSIIGDSAFRDCTSLASATVPSTVSRIGANSFSGCSGLKDIYYNGSQDRWNAIASEAGLPSGVVVHYTHISDGTCGENLTWTLANDGTLTISGTGNMANYPWINSDGTEGTRAPWYQYRDEILCVVISEGVTSVGKWAFWECSSLTEVKIPDGITAIQEGTFRNCTRLTSITIPESVTSIGEYAFCACSSLTEVKIPDGITEISQHAFDGCSGLTSVTIPGSITSISEGVFSDCTSLTSVTIPESVTTIGGAAFGGCTSLTSITIPESVTTIGGAAFSDCSSLTSVTIPESVTIIEGYAFDGCSSLTSVTIPGSVTSIGEEAFKGCSSLTEVIIMEGVATIENWAFDNCTSLNTVHIPSTISSIPYYAFCGCSEVKDIYYNGSWHQWQGIGYGSLPTNATVHTTHFDDGTCGNNLTWMLANDGTLTISGTGAMDGYSHMSFERIPWYYCRGRISHIVISEGVTTIGGFVDCSNLTSITIPESVTVIGNEAFYGCTSLTSVTIPGSVTVIEGGAFYRCTSLTSVTIPESVTSIQNGTFKYCSSLTSITIPESVTFIGEYAFCGCSSLTSITIPESVTSIRNGAFSRCTSLTSITIPESVTSIGAWVFEQCSSLTDINVDPSNKYYCSVDGVLFSKSMKTLKAFPGGRAGAYRCPDGITSIEYYAFEYCTSLTSITIPEGVTKIGYATFAECSSLTSVTIPGSVTSIGEEAFNGCTSLTSITIPEGVTSIGAHAFLNCSSLSELLIPASVTTIGGGAFRDTQIATVLFRGTRVPEALSQALNGMAQLNVIYVPLEALDAFAESCGTPLSEKLRPYDTAPTQISIDALTPDSVTLQWTPVVGAVSYQVFKDGSPADTTTQTTFRDALQAGERYTYQVIANLPCGVTGQAAEIVVETVLPDILSITADNGRVVTANFNTLRAVIDGNPDGLVGSFYYLADGAAVTIADSLTGTAEKDGSVFTADWDNAELPEGEYTVGFVLAFASNPRKCSSREETLTVDHSVPARIVGLRADGDIRNVTLSWGIAEELATNIYRVYRKTDTETEFALLQEITGRNNHSYVDTACEPDTQYEYYVVGVNQYGEESEPSVIVQSARIPDTDAPRILRIVPANGTALRATVTVAVEAEDNLAVTGLQLLLSRDDGETWSELTQSTSGKLNTQLDSTAYPDGTLKLKAIARDAAGNESDPMLCTLTVDNTGPEQVTGLRYEATSVNVTLHWDDVSDEDVAGFLVERAEADGNYSNIAKVTALGINISGLTPGGDYAYRVTAYDRLGNMGTPSEVIAVSTLADTTEPVITKLSPAPGYYSKSIPLSISAEDDYNIAGVRVEVSTNLITWTQTDSREFTGISARRQASFTLKLDEFDEGSLYVRAVAWDTADNESNTGADAPYVEYVVDRTPPAAPEITAEGYAGYAEIRWVKGSEADLNVYTVYRSETENGTFKAITGGLNTLNYIDRNVEDNGVYFYKVAVSDRAGNVSELSAAAGVQIDPDTVAPEIISIYPASGSVLSTGGAEISVLASDNSKLDRIVAEYSLDGSEFTELGRIAEIGASSQTGRWRLPAQILSADAQITVRVYAVDAAGLVSDYVTAGYTVDNEAPGVGTATAVYDDNAVVIRWRSRMEPDLAGYQVYRVDRDGARTRIGARAAVADQLDYMLTDTTVPLEKGSYTYYIEAVDTCGNASGVTTDPVELPDRSSPKPVLHFDYTMEVGVEYLFDATDSTDNSGITSYHLDFGDGSTTTEPSVVHRYQEVGTYTVVLTVTDDDGNISTLTDTVTVKERSEIGKVEITVVDQDGVPVADAPVYFDLGETTQTIRRTDGNGAVSFTADAGKHTVGCVIPDNNWLPVMKSVVVRAGATEQLKMIMVRQTMIEGSFETDRMTFDEIVAAGIDISDPENQHIMQFDVQLTYGEYHSTVETSFTFNPITNRVVNRKPVIVDTDDGERRKLTPIGVIKNSGGSSSSGGSGGGGGSSFEGPDWTAVVILDIPAEASFLKEFFDVKLHIVNNAGSEFSMQENVITLNVPKGLTIVDTAATEGSAAVHIPVIAGQTTCTIPWILRGDEQGDYLLSADYVGILSQFNETVLTTFQAEEPIHVYGKQAVKLLVEANSSSMYGAYYFNLGIMNDSPVEVNLPSVDVIGNVISAYLEGCEDEANSPEVTILGIEVRSETGAIQKLQGDVQVNVLAPGETLVKRFAVYNAVDDRDYKLLKEASVQAAADCGVEIVIREVDMDLFDLKDALEKLGEIRSDPNKLSMYQRIMGQTHYAYVWEALDRDTNFLGLLAEKGYATGKLLFEGKFFYNNEQNKKFTRQLVCTLLQDEAMEQLIADKVDTDSIDMVTKMLKAASGILKEPDLSIPETDKESAERLEMARILEDICGDSSAVRSLASAMVNDDSETFSDRLQTTVLAYASAEYGKEMIRMYLQDSNLVSEATMEAYSETFKELGESIDLISKGIKSWNDAAQYGAELANITAAQEESIALLNMLVENCEDGTPMRKELESIQKDIEDVIAAQRNEFFRKLLECGGEEITTEGIKWAMKFVFGDYGKPALTIIKTVFKTADYVFDWEGASDDKHALRACLQMSDVLGRAALKYPLETENETEAIYIMRALKYMVKMRLTGEQTYVDQMLKKDADGQEAALTELNYWLCAEFSSLDAYLDYLYGTLPAYRDSLFCKRLPQEILRPEAPAVTLDFISHATVESFDSRYEYSYDGGRWSVCDGGPIPVEPKRVGGSLWVRVRATEDTLTGNITKLAVPAQPRIVGDLAATYDGSRYVVTGLAAGVYRIGFKRGEEPAEQYRNIQVSGSGILTVAKTEKFTQLTIQRPAMPDSFESLIREVPVEDVSLPENACGDNLIWLVDDRGILTISGTGAMWDYDSGGAPWSDMNVTGLVLEEGITRIGSNAFANLHLKAALQLPETLEEIGISAFDGCAGLTGTPTIPSGVTGIGDRAFYGCTGLSRTIRIPAATQTLGVNAFGACTRLTAFTVDTGNPCFKAVDGVLYSADGLTLLACPAGKTDMTKIAEGTESIGSSAFDGCVNVKKLTVPTSLGSIAYDAFTGCTNLHDVYYQDTMEQWRQISGVDCLKDVKMHVLYPILYGNLPKVCTNPNPEFGSTDSLLYLKNPTAVGYSFSGWYLDAELTQRVIRIASGRTEALTLYAKITPNSYTVRYAGNGATSGAMSVTKAVYDEPFQLVPNTFVRVGYTFDGWMRSPKGKEAEFVDEQYMDQNLSTVKGGSVTLYAHWVPNTYEVCFNGNGGEGEMDTQIFTYGEYQKLTSNAFYRTGYTFTGWNTQPDGKGKGYANAASLRNLADGEQITEVTLYAMWRANTYTVTFHANGGIGFNTKQTLTYDKPANLTTPGFTWKGHAIDGWMLTADGENIDFEVGQEILNLADSGNVDLYARWRSSEYTIAFHPNGGVGETPSMNRVYNDYLSDGFDTSLPANGFSRVGYDFAGWATSTRGAAVYEDGATVDKNLTATDGATVTLYAVWKPHVYSVAFYPGCDNATGAMQVLTNRKYDTAFRLSANAFKRVGYTFVGWSLKPGADVEFINKQSVLNLAEEQDAVVELYAVWMANDYTITYKNITKEEQDAFGLVQKYTVEQQVLIPGADVIMRDGYTFDGWYTDRYCRYPFIGFDSGTTGNKTLYAKWIANQYTVVFDSGDEDVGSAERTYTYGKSFNLPDVASVLKFARTGYQFAGWQMEDGILLKNKQSVKNLTSEDSVTLTAQWVPIVYKITYKNVTAMEADGYPTTYTVEDGVTLPALDNSVRPGCTFEGWFMDAYFKQPFEDFDAGRTGSLTVYAKWSGTAKTYVVSFDKNDPSATGTMTDMTSLVPGREYTLKANAFSLRGYTFVGWEAENAKVATLTNRQKFSSLARDDASVVTLKAQWEPTEYKITYRNILATDDNAGNPATYTVASDEVFLNDPIRDGYTFGGWYTDTSLRKPFVSIPQGEIGNRTVFAKWISNTYTVIFDSGIAEGEPVEKAYRYNAIYTLPDVTGSLHFAKDGYRFTGWQVIANAEELDMPLLGNRTRVKNLVPEGEVELVAQWEPIQYRITYKNLTAMEVEASGNPTVYTVDDQFELKDPSRPGCTFAGWFLDRTCRKPVTGIDAETTGSKTFYAKWTGKADAYSIHFEGNGATSGVMRDQTGLVCGKEYALTANAFKRTGYDFLGWSADEQSQEPDLLNRQKVSTLIADGETSVTLYAVWAPREYTIIYRNVTAEEAQINDSVYTVEAPVQFNDPQREGYTFLGWYIGGKPAGDTNGRSGNLTVYARWLKEE